jgi:hypothetical protein
VKPAVTLSSVSVASASSRPVKSRIRVKLTCGSGPACSGVLNLQVRLRGAALRAFGRARYSLASGGSTWVALRISSHNIGLLKKRHSMRVYGTAVDTDGTSGQSSFMLHAPKRRRSHKH